MPQHDCYKQERYGLNSDDGYIQHAQRYARCLRSYRSSHDSQYKQAEHVVNDCRTEYDSSLACCQSSHIFENACSDAHARRAESCAYEDMTERGLLWNEISCHSPT